MKYKSFVELLTVYCEDLVKRKKSYLKNQSSFIGCSMFDEPLKDIVFNELNVLGVSFISVMFVKTQLFQTAIYQNNTWAFVKVKTL